MENKFTKGEWHAIQYANYWAIQNVAYYDDKSDLLNEEDFPEHAKANALLMSKSPELLSMVCQLKEAVGMLSLAQSQYPNYKKLITRAEQLITEATTI